MNILTHNGWFTIENTNTGGHRTFKVKTQPDDAKFAPGKRILSLLTGPDRDDPTNLESFAFIRPDKVCLWKRFKIDSKYATYADMLTNPEAYEARGCRYLMEGRCRVCNRRLTVPESIDAGIGPICAERV